MEGGGGDERKGHSAVGRAGRIEFSTFNLAPSPLVFQLVLIIWLGAGNKALATYKIPTRDRGLPSANARRRVVFPEAYTPYKKEVRKVRTPIERQLLNRALVAIEWKSGEFWKPNDTI